jgi:hypothetical protein
MEVLVTGRRIGIEETPDAGRQTPNAMEVARVG